MLRRQLWVEKGQAPFPHGACRVLGGGDSPAQSTPVTCLESHGHGAPRGSPTSPCPRWGAPPRSVSRPPPQGEERVWSLLLSLAAPAPLPPPGFHGLRPHEQPRLREARGLSTHPVILAPGGRMSWPWLDWAARKTRLGSRPPWEQSLRLALALREMGALWGSRWMRPVGTLWGPLPCPFPACPPPHPRGLVGGRSSCLLPVQLDSPGGLGQRLQLGNTCVCVWGGGWSWQR